MALRIHNICSCYTNGYITVEGQRNINVKHLIDFISKREQHMCGFSTWKTRFDFWVPELQKNLLFEITKKIKWNHKYARDNAQIPGNHALQNWLYFLAKIWDLCAWETNPDCQEELLACTYQKNLVSWCYP